MLKKRVKDIVIKSAKELNIPVDKALEAYKSYWLFVKEKIENMSLEGITEEDFNNIRSSINVIGLGKFSTSYKRIKNIDKKKEITNERIKNKKRNSTT